MLIAGSIYLLKSLFNSITHSKSFIDENEFILTKNPRFIYNKKGQKLYADFIFGKKHDYIAVLYAGYGVQSGFVDSLKKHYTQAGYNVVIICANGFGISGGNKKVDDNILSEELFSWLTVIKGVFGSNSKILLHGFSYTALSVLNCAGNCCAVLADNTYFCPAYNYKKIKNKVIKKIYKKQSQGILPEINIPVFFSSYSHLSKETYKLYEISSSHKSAYIYENFDCDEYIRKLDKFIRHLKQPEE